MNALQRFEGWVQGLLEDGLGGLLGARIQPVDVAKRLADHMEDNRTVGAGKRYVPNIYRVFLAPRTLAGFAAFQAALEEELAEFLDRRARERGYAFVGRVQVALLADPELRRERVRIESDLVDRQGLVLDGAAQHTEALAIPPAQRTPDTRPLQLVLDRRRIRLDPEQAMTVGRALDNDIILDDPSVSRNHARLVPRGRHWAVEDLGSTHGSYVNGQPVETCLLRAGDRLRLGGVTGRLRVAPDADAEQAADGSATDEPRDRNDRPSDGARA